MYSVAELKPYDLAKIVVGSEIGARPGEIRGLKWSDIDEEKLTINIERQVIRVKGEGLSFAPPKTKRIGATPITARQLRILLDHKRYQSLNKSMWVTDLDLIFPNPIGKMLDESKDKRWMKNICERATIPRYSLYQLRKTAFTELLMASDVGTTMAFSGHSQASTLLKHYISPEVGAVRKAIEKREIANPALQAEVIDINRSA
jgi:integrase